MPENFKEDAEIIIIITKSKIYRKIIILGYKYALQPILSIIFLNNVP